MCLNLQGNYYVLEVFVGATNPEQPGNCLRIINKLLPVLTFLTVLMAAAGCDDALSGRSLATTSSTVSPGCCRRVRACCWLIPGSRGLPLITRIWSLSWRRPSLQPRHQPGRCFNDITQVVLIVKFVSFILNNSNLRYFPADSGWAIILHFQYYF